MKNNAGFIYRNEKGEFLLRIINRGHFDEDHYVLKFVTVFEWGCLLHSEIVIDENNRDSLTKIKYRTLFSKELMADCVCENVVVSGNAYHGFELEVVSEFEKRLKLNRPHLDASAIEAKFIYEAGQKSQQAKIDSLNKNIEALHVEIERIQKEYQGMFEGVQGRQKTIDKLQGRIDGALEKCYTGIRKQGGDYYLELVQDILKGNKDG